MADTIGKKDFEAFLTQMETSVAERLHDEAGEEVPYVAGLSDMLSYVRQYLINSDKAQLEMPLPMSRPGQLDQTSDNQKK